MKNGKLVIYQWPTWPDCAIYRLNFPGAALNRLQQFDVRLLPQFGFAQYQEVLRDADIFIIQRMRLSDDFARVILELNQRGILVVYEIDDDLMHLDPASKLAAIVTPDFASQIENCIRACQCVQCSTPALAATIAHIHREVVVLENQMDRVPPFVGRVPKSRNLVVGYAAGGNHGPDWPVVRDAYNQTVKKLLADGVLVDTWIIGDTEIFDSVESSRKLLFPVLEREAYLRLLGHFDISIIPLNDSIFNESKSDLKFLESAAAGAAVLAGERVYGRTIRDGQTGLLFRDADEFSLKLRQLATDRDLVDRLARSGHQYVLQNRLYEQHAEAWAAIYMGWYERREELLAAARLGRM